MSKLRTLPKLSSLLFGLLLLQPMGCGDDGGSTALDTARTDANDISGDTNGDLAAEVSPDVPADSADAPDTAPFFHDVFMPDIAALDPGWNVLYPGGDTLCARGTEYAFFVRPGTVDKVVVDFVGGGACWSAGTCSLSEALFSDTIDGELATLQSGTFAGIYDAEHPDNPFADWTHVVLPYCTGDLHWGDAVVDYQGFNPVTIHHNGANNTKAVLAWIYANLQAPTNLFVTGCSAGSYGSILWSSHLMEHYPDASVVQFGDSGAGIITDTFFLDSFPSWNTLPQFPAWIPTLDPAQVDVMGMALTDLYVRLGNYYTGQQFSQYNTELDDNQSFYFEAMGGAGGAAAWSGRMLASMDAIEAGATNFHSYLATGEQHCILGFDNFYTVEEEGVRLVDWLDTMVNEQPVDSVRCATCVP